MTLSRVCLALLLVVCLDSVAGKPFFGEWICDWFCPDYEDDDGSSSGWDFDCDDCNPQRTTTTLASTTAVTPAPVIPGPDPTPIIIQIPSGSSAYNLTLMQTDNKWSIIMGPTPDAGGQSSTTTGTTTVVTTTTAGTTTAAATTAGASTAAPDATTAAATTAAATTAAK